MSITNSRFTCCCGYFGRYFLSFRLFAVGADGVGLFVGEWVFAVSFRCWGDFLYRWVALCAAPDSDDGTAQPSRGDCAGVGVGAAVIVFVCAVCARRDVVDRCAVRGVFGVDGYRVDDDPASRGLTGLVERFSYSDAVGQWVGDCDVYALAARDRRRARRTVCSRRKGVSRIFQPTSGMLAGRFCLSTWVTRWQDFSCCGGWAFRRFTR